MKEAEARTIKLRWIDTTTDLLKGSLVWELMSEADVRQAFKWQVLARLGITRSQGEDPIGAWLRAMAEENDLPVTTPCHTDLADAILWNTNASRFMWFLA